MNLDLLISKYIDGELSVEQDNELRALIAGSPDARSVYDATIGIHCEVKEDARRIVTPPDLLHQTEDAVLMKILASVPVTRIEYRSHRILKYSASIAAMILIFLTFAVKIKDGSNLNYLPFFNGQSNAEINASNSSQSEYSAGSDSNILQTAEQPSNSVKTIKSVVPSNKIDIKVNKNLLTSGSDNNSSNRIFKDNENELNLVVLNPNPVIEKISDSKETHSSGDKGNFQSSYENLNSDKINSETDFPITLQKEDKKEPDIMNDLNIPVLLSESNIEKHSDGNSMQHKLLNAMNDQASEQETPIKNLNQKFPSVSIGNPIHLTDLVPQEVHLNTFFAYELGSKDNSKRQLMSDFSQSVAYTVSERFSLGLEFGTKEYSYQENTKLQVPKTEFHTKTLVENSGMSDAGSGYFVPMKFDRVNHLFWGTAFCDASIINEFNTTLIVRVGLGSSEEGFLGFGRLYGKTNLYGGFFLTFGLDAKGYSAKIKTINSDSYEFRYGTSLIYGIQFSF